MIDHAGKTDDVTVTDGRQSERALAIRRGVARHFGGLDATCLFEATLANGRRSDVIAIFPDGKIEIVEVKSSVADFNADQKWPEYRDFCDAFWFATAPDVPSDIFPEDEGLIIADPYGAHIMRPARREALHASRRKALTLRLARLAAGRLHRLEDPAIGFSETW